MFVQLILWYGFSESGSKNRNVFLVFFFFSSTRLKPRFDDIVTKRADCQCFLIMRRGRGPANMCAV